MSLEPASQVRIATRGSKLALWQAEYVKARLIESEPGLAVSLVVLKTEGDRVLDRPLALIGGKGLFTKEIEEALLDGRADIAVHSMKDMPAHIPDGLVLSAVPERADPSDALVLGRPHQGLVAGTRSAGELLGRLPAGARVGTSSLRRVSQLLALRADLVIVPLRGNVDTRLRKLDDGELDAAVLASAGLSRLGFGDRIARRFSPDEMVPACGQGALGLQCRSDAPEIARRLALLSCARATATALAERAFALRIGGSCQTPLGAHASLRPQPGGEPELTMVAMVGSTDGKTVLRDGLHGPLAQGEALGRELAERLLAVGAADLIQPPR